MYLEGMREEGLVQSEGTYQDESGMSSGEQRLDTMLGGSAHRTVETDAEVIDLAAMKRELEGTAHGL